MSDNTERDERMEALKKVNMEAYEKVQDTERDEWLATEVMGYEPEQTWKGARWKKGPLIIGAFKPTTDANDALKLLEAGEYEWGSNYSHREGYSVGIWKTCFKGSQILNGEVTEVHDCKTIEHAICEAVLKDGGYYNTGGQSGE